VRAARREVLILGCQRSGTTLLRLLLGAHPQVASVDEALAYPILAGRRRLEDEVGAAAERPFVAFKIPRLSEQLLEPDLRDEAYGRFPQFYRGQRGVFVVRDPRDVVGSMCTLRADRDRSWIATYGRGTILHRAGARESFARRYAAEIAQLEQAGWPDHLAAAMYWQLKNDALPAYLAAGLPLLPLRYEALVADPEPWLRRILAHLGIGWDEAVLAHHRAEHDQLDADGRAIGGSDPRRPIDRSSVGRHRGLLGPERLAEVEAWTAATAAALGQCLEP
jgi:hypothetical protein